MSLHPTSSTKSNVALSRHSVVCPDFGADGPVCPTRFRRRLYLPPPPAVHLYHSIDDFGDDLDSDGADAMAKGGSYACDLLADGGLRKPATIYMGSCAPDESGLGTVGCGITVHDGIVTGPRATFVSPFLHHNPPRSTWEVARPMKVA
jgi:hypothetical protein